ncbi:NmrA family NAD(P)-binding protein [Kutzneria sp. CA-103260]|uniref:NmrA family NAD(P)-binding protein n=1 Tax=Kutzneria sp. CA-103260 TaxID=2802641 RepID=UPI001BA65F8F|nr:NAD(P)H-binding protein [Kutzneria sp. CA-103260]QUQ67203.1 hydroxylase [Kutzneria sp. CA-103260]
MSQRILVTGATGRTGGGAVATLLQQGHEVRALVHHDDDRSARLAADGVDIVVGDLLDFDAVSRATKGIDAAYFVHPIAPGLLDATATMLQAAEDNDVRALVNMSQISARRDAGSNAARQHWLSERLLDHFPGAVTHLRPTFFAEWLYIFADHAAGELRLPFADARHAPIAAEDQGRVIAAILADPGPHAGKTYPLHGPVELDHHQIADAVSRTLGTPFTYVPISIDEFRADLARQGHNPHRIQHLANVAVDYRNGIFAGTNDIVRTVTGVEPLTVEAFVDRNRDQFAVR